MNASPSLSVVVGLISGRPDDLRRCLGALARQTVAPAEVLVPYDDACAAVTALQAEFPHVRFIRAEGLDTTAARAGASREHHDTLRTIGLRAARSDFIALTEDHAHAAPNWCAGMVDALLHDPDAAAVGGAVECDSPSALNWAVWFCDFGRYQNPLPDGPAVFVSDSNVTYRRSALDRVRDAWQGDYHETAVHEAMVAAGLTLRTTSAVVVWQARTGLRWSTALVERFVWARSFAGTRAKLAPSRRWVLAALSPLLPAVMTWRVVQITRVRGRHTSRLVGVLPHVVVLQSAWAVGELVGYLTADPG
jgi:hypothetical protein